MRRAHSRTRGSSGAPIALGRPKLEAAAVRRRSNSGAAIATSMVSFSPQCQGSCGAKLGKVEKGGDPRAIRPSASSFRRAGPALGASFHRGDNAKCHADGAAGLLRSRWHHRGDLSGNKLRVDATLGEERGMRSGLSHAAAVENHDQVGIADRQQPMRDDDGCAAGL